MDTHINQNPKAVCLLCRVVVIGVLKDILISNIELCCLGLGKN